ncbi:hypothetical protein F2P56_012164 [Juglans regia]|uniref:Uncharacterized protein n=2 Tax=Juglans regia TaxID=51240 RepID=A0A834CQH8_JUGRE|nr:uncharacterized protein LOC108983799 [Juglans regia]KAF5467964.1 hypothetical protein F2P56_012164 [Juglans regia]
MDKTWMHLTDRFRSREYGEGVRQFLIMARAHALGNNNIKCPCRRCRNNLFLPISQVERHLFITGIDPTYTDWIFHGEQEPMNFMGPDDEEPDNLDDSYVDDIDDMLGDIHAATTVGIDEDAAPHTSGTSTVEPEPTTFEKLLEDARRPLYDGCTTFSKLSFIVKLLHIKSIGGWSIKSFNMLLKLLKTAFPKVLLPDSFHDARSLERGLGFTYIKIHACPNDCVLFYKENINKQECPKCKASRWLSSSTPSKRPVPQKVVRYFPLKPRLQRLFMSKKTASSMRWHRSERVHDESTLRHPADSEVWTTFDREHRWFAEDARNVRLGLASDGFNPFNNMSKPYSIWPVILVPYNLPPWLCMKDPFFMLSALIPGPKSPGNEIDVYLRPLVDELLDLWENGVDTYDAMVGQRFQLHAALLWTINDFPAYGNLSGWSTKGKLACPCCNLDTESQWLRHGRKHCYMGHRRFLPVGHIWRSKKSSFNGKEDHRLPPMQLLGEDILHQLNGIGHVDFGKASKRRKRAPEELNWTKRSIFFDLPYWPSLKLRHNLDVMHIEKNICDNVLGTLMDIPGKTKDGINARRDLAELRIRKDLHLREVGDRVIIPHAYFMLHGDERKKFCSWLNSVKFPDGFASNISRCVNVTDCKISGMKSHDAHIFMQRLLPAAIGGYLRHDIRVALMELSSFFSELCARTCKKEAVKRLETDIVLILCKLEMIFPPNFFDVMVHLAIHLPRELMLGGPVQYRWMYPFERYLGKFKRYVKNKARPEGSIAEAYIHEECLTFSSMYLHDVPTRFTREDRNIDVGVQTSEISGFSIFSQKVRPLGNAIAIHLEKKLFKTARWYALNNCTEIDQYLEEHNNILKEQSISNIERRHEVEFPSWFRKRIQALRATDPLNVSDDLYAIACGPDPWVGSYSGCIMNGIRFHTKLREVNRRTQNSGVVVTSEHQGTMVDFYGVLNDILEVRYMGWRRVWLFSCDWFDVGDTIRGIKIGDHLTSVNMSKTWYKDDPFVLASQASQVFYLKDTKLSGSWHVVQKITYRNVYDVESVHLDDEGDDSTEANVFQEEQSSDVLTHVQIDQNGIQSPWLRADVEPNIVSTNALSGGTHHIVEDQPNMEGVLEDEESHSSDTMSNPSTDEDLLEDTDSETDDENSSTDEQECSSNSN